MAEAKRYSGSCHCGAVKYEVTTDLASVMECNCSHCARKGFLLSFVAVEQFRLLQGQDALGEYRFNKHKIEHLFCKTCGVQSFMRGKRPDGADVIGLNVRCLEGVEPASLTIAQVDGRAF
jgi:hypothetical protein